MNARKNAKLLHPNGRLSGSPRITPQPGEAEVKVEQRQSPKKAVPAIAAPAAVNAVEQEEDKSEDATSSTKRKAEDEQAEIEENKRVKVEPGQEDNTVEVNSVNLGSQDSTENRVDEVMPEDVKPETAMLEQPSAVAPRQTTESVPASTPAQEIAAPATVEAQSLQQAEAASAPVAAPMSLAAQLQALSGMFPRATETEAQQQSQHLSPQPPAQDSTPAEPVLPLATAESLDLDVDDEALYGNGA